MECGVFIFVVLAFFCENELILTKFLYDFYEIPMFELSPLKNLSVQNRFTQNSFLRAVIPMDLHPLMILLQRRVGMASPKKEHA